MYRALAATAGATTATHAIVVNRITNRLEEIFEISTQAAQAFS